MSLTLCHFQDCLAHSKGLSILEEPIQVRKERPDIARQGL